MFHVFDVVINYYLCKVELRHPLQELIAEGEHQRQDFKFEVNDPRKVAITLSAFSNSDGGRLLIGVKDNGNIRGVRPDEEFHVVQSAASRYCDPNIIVISRIWKFKDKQVLEVEVEAAAHKPVYAIDAQGKNIAYVRIEDKNIHADPVMLELWKQQNSPRDYWLQYKAGSEQLLKFIAEEGKSLNQLMKLSSISRRALILQMAYLVRWELAEFELKTDHFVLKAVNPGKQ